MSFYLTIRVGSVRNSSRTVRTFALFSWLAVAMLFSGSIEAAQIRDLAEVQGARTNMLKGIGLVVGLAGTGDKAAAALQAQQHMLDRLGVETRSAAELSSSNIAVCMVTAVLPPFAKEGTRLDVKVDSLYDCKSLEGGMLLETHLKGPGLSETVYAVAQGPISVGGYTGEARGGSRGRQHATSGRIPMGAWVEREAPSTITDGERIMLLIKQPDFSHASAIQEVIARELGADSAVALGGGAVRVTIPKGWQHDLVGFIAHVLGMHVMTAPPARVVINERTGTIVVGGNVVVRPCQVAHGSLTIRVSEPQRELPALAFSDPTPDVPALENLEALASDAYLMPIQGTSAADVAEALNRLRVTPADMIAIFQALREAGALTADLEIM